MHNENPRSDRWKLWLRWVLATTIGFVLGIGGSLAISSLVSEILASILFGVVAGFVQWLVLRKIFRHSEWWILASALSISFGFGLINTVNRLILWAGPSSVVYAIGLGMLGLAVGTSQWLVLRNHFNKAGWWILANTAGWAAGGLLYWMVFLGFPEFISIIAEYALLGIIVGGSTGLVLILLIKSQTKLQAESGSLLAKLVISICILVVIILAIRLEPGFEDRTAVPDLDPDSTCSNLPALECAGDETYCTEIVPFEPVTGPGYANYPENGETRQDQYRSFLRRDLMMAVKYATSKVMCVSEDWEYSQFNILGIGDMSEEDGSIPGTSTGNPGHPMGTHQDGNDIDIAYYQMDFQNNWHKLKKLSAENEGNFLRIMCKHTKFGIEVFHCTEPALLLDPWRTALFIAYLADHPRLRVIGVDGQIGPVLDEALDEIVLAGWIDSGSRDLIPLVYETTNEGMGWFKFHHHHMHISFQEK